MATERATVTGASALADALIAQDVEYFFNLPGNGLYPLLNRLFDHPELSYVLGLHEFAVVAMADGYARASGKVGFANTYMVPGTANALSAVYTAHRDKSPVVLTSTQQATGTVGRDAYASATDLVGMVRQHTKWAWEVTRPERLPEAIHRAFKVAATPPQGPVFLSIPFDLLADEIDTSLTEPSRPSVVPALGPPSPADLNHIADLLVAAERPLLIGGKDVADTSAVEGLVALADMLGAPVVNEPWNGVMAFPQPHPLGLGDYTRVKFDELKPDLVVSFGARMFTEALGRPEPAFPEGTHLVAIGANVEDMGRQYPADVSSLCDVRLAIEALLERCRGRVETDSRRRRLEQIDGFARLLDEEARQLLAQVHDDQPMRLPRLAAEINTVIGPDVVIVEQATTSTGVLRRYLDVPRPGNYLSTGGSVQGWGLPAAMGAQLGRPDDPVVGIIGDGGFAFGMQAAWSAGHYGIPVTMVVLNNQGYRSMRRGVHERTHQSTPTQPDFGFGFDVGIPAVAEAMGMHVQRIERPEDVAEALKAAMESGRPDLLEVAIAPDMSFVASQGAPMAL